MEMGCGDLIGILALGRGGGGIVAVGIVEWEFGIVQWRWVRYFSIECSSSRQEAFYLNGEIDVQISLRTWPRGGGV